MRQIEGGCHCGNIRFQFLWPLVDTQIPVRACGCSFCTKHSGIYTSHPEAQLAVEIVDRSLVNKYMFGTKTAEFHICSRCGVVPFVTSTIDGREYAVVNVNTFNDVDPSELTSSVSNFDAETTADRLGRRKRSWIPNVSVTHAHPEA
ncbi:MAG: GFA family protein [Acidiferrobacterales bacterium]